MGKIKVLVVDDSKVVQVMIKDYLSPELYSVREAYNGNDGLELFGMWGPDLIFLDIMMPGLSGYTVLKEIRKKEKADPQMKKTPVIMVTGLSDKSDIVDCLKLGIQGYMVKPFKPEDIAQRMEKALNPNG